MKHFLAFVLSILFVGAINAQTTVPPPPPQTNWFHGNIITDGSVNSALVGGIPQTNMFAGTDFCSQLRNAALWAVANNINLIDATHYPKTVSCSTDPLTALDGVGTGGNVPVTILMPASRINSTVAWNINNSNVQLIGKGPAETIIAYTGATIVGQVVTIGGSTTSAWFADNVRVENLSIIGGSANATDGLAIIAAGNGIIQNVYTWGVTGCGIHAYNSVTETFYKPNTSGAAASHNGYSGAGYSTPAHGLCLDQTTPGSYTTDGTVIDAVAEGLTGSGWNLIAAQGMTFTSGTSESNVQGITLATNAIFNSFTNSDLESNTQNTSGVDISDSGYGNKYKNVIAISACSGCNSVSLNGSSNIPPDFEGGKYTSIGGTQGIEQRVDPNFGATYIGYGTGGLAAESTLTSSANPFAIYAPNLANGSILGFCIGVDRYCSTSYNSLQQYFNYYGTGSTGNFWGLRILGGPTLRWDGNGSLFAGFGSSGTLGGSGGWWKQLQMGSGNTYTTYINPPASPAASNTLTLPSETGTLALTGTTCTMATGTTCTVSIGYGANCVATVQGSTPLYAACSISAGTATVTASSSNSDTWAVMIAN